ncbi:GntR family transcriptional regulator [Sphaerimonospora sp. CA-214678]|uniref:GntR family transcriptional regulator n=1 Tax=Sphaerimonospora sp. CA-214678 TaxID=3240029 RepID=UPI003D8B305C
MYELLLQQLMDGTRQPSDPLNISALSKEFNVSQTPLREALARLEHSGLVHREALKGYFVAAPFTLDEIVKLTETRLLLEPAIAREAALRRTPEFIKDLEATVVLLADVANGADSSTTAFSQYWSADDRFHNLIAMQSGNPFLQRTYEFLSAQVQRFRLFSKMGNTGAGAAAEEHRRVLIALASGDGDAAAEAMREHVELACQRALRRADSADAE